MSEGVRFPKLGIGIGKRSLPLGRKRRFKAKPGLSGKDAARTPPAVASRYTDQSKSNTAMNGFLFPARNHRLYNLSQPRPVVAVVTG